MAEAKRLKPFILRWEGGYSNDPDDSGGATNKGITIATFRHYYGANATIQQLKALTDDQWMHIYLCGFWNPFKADNIANQSVANICVDWAWASGTGTAIKRVQSLVGVKVDGIVGEQTLSAINNSNQRLLFTRIKSARLRFVEAIVNRDPKQKKYINGWKRRINSLSFAE